MAKIKLTFDEAVEYVWENSKRTREIISEIIVENGVRDGVISEDEDGEFWIVEEVRA